MNFKRAIITLMVLMLLPGLAMAQDGIGETVRFEVNKIWVDTALGIWPNTGQDVDVEIVCNTGLPLTQQATINSGPNGGVVFVVSELTDIGNTVCTISEIEVPAGFTEWSVKQEGLIPDDLELGGCVFTGGVDLNIGDNDCLIINQAQAGSITVFTNWTIDGSGGDVVEQVAGIDIWCDAAILDDDAFFDDGYWYFDTVLFGDDNVTVGVNAAVGGTNCWVDDDVVDSSVETSTNCGGGLLVLPGDSDTCIFEYTVFYEGIPTLSQYGLAIMALLMLGVGFVGFRRFV